MLEERTQSRSVIQDLRQPQTYVTYRPTDGLVRAACVLGAYWGIQVETATWPKTGQLDWW